MTNNTWGCLHSHPVFFNAVALFSLWYKMTYMYTNVAACSTLNNLHNQTFTENETNFTETINTPCGFPTVKAEAINSNQENVNSRTWGHSIAMKHHLLLSTSVWSPHCLLNISSEDPYLNRGVSPVLSSIPKKINTCFGVWRVEPLHCSPTRGSPPTNFILRGA